MKDTDHAGTAIREARKRLSPPKSQEGVARDLGVSVMTYGAWERGDVQPNSTNLLRLADYFGCEPRELVAPESPEAA